MWFLQGHLSLNISVTDCVTNGWVSYLSKKGYVEYAVVCVMDIQTYIHLTFAHTHTQVHIDKLAHRHSHSQIYLS